MSWLSNLIAAVNEKPLQPPEPKSREPEVKPEQGTAWCSNKLCDTWRVYDVLPGHPATKMYGAIPSFAFCTHCGVQIDVDLPEPEEAA